MSRKHKAQSAIKRYFNAPLIGDTKRDVDYSPVSPEITPNEILADAESNKIPLRLLIQTLLKLGHDPKLVCGIESCTEHIDWLSVSERFSQTSTKAGQYTYGIDIVWCRECGQWVRDPIPQNLPADYIVE